jgi:hypothetical protein
MEHDSVQDDSVADDGSIADVGGNQKSDVLVEDE